MTDSTEPSSRAATTDGAAPAVADWEDFMKDVLEDDILSDDDYASTLLAVLRDFLRLPDAQLDNAAVDEASRKNHDCYRDAYLDKEDRGSYFRPREDHGAHLMTITIVPYIWELASQFPETDIRHIALADLLIAIKRDSATEFDPEVNLARP